MSQSVPIGYSDVPRGHIASVVTDLEMLSKPATAELPLPEGITLTPASRVSLDAYRALFRKSARTGYGSRGCSWPTRNWPPR